MATAVKNGWLQPAKHKLLASAETLPDIRSWLTLIATKCLGRSRWRRDLSDGSEPDEYLGWACITLNGTPLLTWRDQHLSNVRTQLAPTLKSPLALRVLSIHSQPSTSASQPAPSAVSTSTSSSQSSSSSTSSSQSPRTRRQSPTKARVQSPARSPHGQPIVDLSSKQEELNTEAAPAFAPCSIEAQLVETADLGSDDDNDTDGYEDDDKNAVDVKLEVEAEVEVEVEARPKATKRLKRLDRTVKSISLLDDDDDDDDNEQDSDDDFLLDTKPKRKKVIYKQTTLNPVRRPRGQALESLESDSSTSKKTKTTRSQPAPKKTTAKNKGKSIKSSSDRSATGRSSSRGRSPTKLSTVGALELTNSPDADRMAIFEFVPSTATPSTSTATTSTTTTTTNTSGGGGNRKRGRSASRYLPIADEDPTPAPKRQRVTPTSSSKATKKPKHADTQFREYSLVADDDGINAAVPSLPQPDDLATTTTTTTTTTAMEVERREPCSPPVEPLTSSASFFASPEIVNMPNNSLAADSSDSNSMTIDYSSHNIDRTTNSPSIAFSQHPLHTTATATTTTTTTTTSDRSSSSSLGGITFTIMDATEGEEPEHVLVPRSHGAGDTEPTPSGPGTQPMIFSQSSSVSSSFRGSTTRSPPTLSAVNINANTNANNNNNSIASQGAWISPSSPPSLPSMTTITAATSSHSATTNSIPSTNPFNTSESADLDNSESSSSQASRPTPHPSNRSLLPSVTSTLTTTTTTGTDRTSSPTKSSRAHAMVLEVLSSDVEPDAVDLYDSDEEDDDGAPRLAALSASSSPSKSLAPTRTLESATTEDDDDDESYQRLLAQLQHGQLAHRTTTTITTSTSATTSTTTTNANQPQQQQQPISPTHFMSQAPTPTQPLQSPVTPATMLVVQTTPTMTAIATPIAPTLSVNNNTTTTTTTTTTTPKWPIHPTTNDENSPMGAWRFDGSHTPSPMVARVLDDVAQPTPTTMRTTSIGLVDTQPSQPPSPTQAVSGTSTPLRSIAAVHHTPGSFAVSPTQPIPTSPTQHYSATAPVTPLAATASASTSSRGSATKRSARTGRNGRAVRASLETDGGVLFTPPTSPIKSATGSPLKIIPPTSPTKSTAAAAAVAGSTTPSSFADQVAQQLSGFKSSIQELETRARSHQSPLAPPVATITTATTTTTTTTEPSRTPPSISSSPPLSSATTVVASGSPSSPPSSATTLQMSQPSSSGSNTSSITRLRGTSTRTSSTGRISASGRVRSTPTNGPVIVISENGSSFPKTQEDRVCIYLSIILE